MLPDRPYRVIQWATGAMGRGMLRAVATRPDLELAGVYVHDPAKIGQDAGRLCGLPETGIRATGEVAEILDISADCVLYAPLSPALLGGHTYGDIDTICAILASGKNLITCTGLIYPHVHGPGLVGALEKACAAGGTSVHGTGISPGFLSDLLPLILTGLAREVEHVYVRECSDLAGHPSRRFVHDLAGLGKTEAEYLRALPASRQAMRALFAEGLHLMAGGMGAELDHLDLDHEYVLADTDFEIATGPIRRGTVAGHRWSFNGLTGSRPLITLETSFLADAERVRGWRSPGYTVRMAGHPSITVDADADWISNGLTAAAAHAVNSVPVVCRAAPGIRTLLDLPPVTGRAAGLRS